MIELTQEERDKLEYKRKVGEALEQWKASLSAGRLVEEVVKRGVTRIESRKRWGRRSKGFARGVLKGYKSGGAF